jgi:hypothetical protein
MELALDAVRQGREAWRFDVYPNCDAEIIRKTFN